MTVTLRERQPGTPDSPSARTVDLHSHVDELAENEHYTGIWQVEGATDHYVWSMIRKRGVDDRRSDAVRPRGAPSTEPNRPHNYSGISVIVGTRPVSRWSGRLLAPAARQGRARRDAAIPPPRLPTGRAATGDFRYHPTIRY